MCAYQWGRNYPHQEFSTTEAINNPWGNCIKRCHERQIIFTFLLMLCTKHTYLSNVSAANCFPAVWALKDCLLIHIPWAHDASLSFSRCLRWNKQDGTDRMVKLGHLIRASISLVDLTLKSLTPVVWLIALNGILYQFQCQRFQVESSTMRFPACIGRMSG